MRYREFFKWTQITMLRHKDQWYDYKMIGLLLLVWKNLSVPGVNDALQRHHCAEDNVVEHEDKPWLMILSHSHWMFPQPFGGDGLQNRMQVKNNICIHMLQWHALFQSISLSILKRFRSWSSQKQSQNCIVHWCQRRETPKQPHWGSHLQSWELHKASGSRAW